MDRYKPATEDEKKIRDIATRESHPYNSPQANYPRAEEYRRSRNEGVALRERST